MEPNTTGNYSQPGKEDLTYEIWVSFAVFFTISGLLGSIFFLVSVIYARIKKTHDFDKSHIFIFLSNLAISDALSCIFLLANWFVGMLGVVGVDITNKEVLCKVLILTRQNLGVIDGWSTGAFAFNAAFPRLR